MTAPRGDDVHRHAGIEQERLVGAAQVVEAQTRKAETARPADKFFGDDIAVAEPRDECRSAASASLNATDDPLLKYPITGIAGSCARAATGQAAAAPPSSVMNSRRLLIQSPRRQLREAYLAP